VTADSSRLRIASSTTEVILVPSEGGRVDAVVDLATGRNLLARHGPGGRRDDWYAGAPGGWDEMFPNDSGWEGHAAHGRVWSAELYVADTQGDIVLVGALEQPAVDLRRTYRLLAPPRVGLRIDTEIEARAATGPFLWSSHPMLAVEPGWEVRIAATHAEVDRVMPGRFADAAGNVIPWTGALPIPSASEGWGEVLYFSGCDTAEVASPETGAGTRIRWNADFFRDVWVVTVTGFDGFDLGFLFEPSTTRPFRLEDAIERGRALTMEPGERVAFWVELEGLSGREGPRL